MLSCRADGGRDVSRKGTANTSAPRTGAAKHSISSQPKKVNNQGVTKRGLAAPADTVMLQFGNLLCRGSSGAVCYGAVGDTPAIIKLYGPDSQGVAACHREGTILGKFCTALRSQDSS